MPTFNQLVRKGRQTAVKKSTAFGEHSVVLIRGGRVKDLPGTKIPHHQRYS